MNLHCLFVNPNTSYVYQDLADDMASIQPNEWASMLANSCRNKGYSVAILDTNALRLNDIDASSQINDAKAKLVVFVVTGSNPNASTQAMGGAIKLATYLKQYYPHNKICFVGPHVNALPKETLNFECIDLVLTNEGVYSLHNLLQSNLTTDLYSIKGIGYKINGECIINPPEIIVPQDKLEQDLPLMALDLLLPPSKYRTSHWHNNYHDDIYNFSSLYSSLGCFAKCAYCMISIINRMDNNENLSASDMNIFRHWEPKFVVDYLEKLAESGVKHLKISDEMHVYKPKHFLEIWKESIRRGLKFNIWGYARVSTVKEQYLDILKEAGFSYIALGIESSSYSIRMQEEKGTFKDVDIRDIVRKIENHGIEVIANYIYGLGDETFETMQRTYDMACELNTSHANMYGLIPLPGSSDFIKARNEHKELPPTFDAYGFLSYECLPLANKNLSSKDILKFRDEKFIAYYQRPEYLDMIEKKFGIKAKENVQKYYSRKLKRKILGD